MDDSTVSKGERRDEPDEPDEAGDGGDGGDGEVNVDEGEDEDETSSSSRSRRRGEAEVSQEPHRWFDGLKIRDYAHMNLPSILRFLTINTRQAIPGCCVDPTTVRTELIQRLWACVFPRFPSMWKSFPRTKFGCMVTIAITTARSRSWSPAGSRRPQKNEVWSPPPRSHPAAPHLFCGYNSRFSLPP